MLVCAETGVTEYFDPPENPGPGPNFTEKVDPPQTKDILFFTYLLILQITFLCF